MLVFRAARRRARRRACIWWVRRKRWIRRERRIRWKRRVRRIGRSGRRTARRRPTAVRSRPSRVAPIDFASQAFDLGSQLGKTPLALLSLAPFVQIPTQSPQLLQQIVIAALGRRASRLAISTAIPIAAVAQVPLQVIDVALQLFDEIAKVVLLGLTSVRSRVAAGRALLPRFVVVPLRSPLIAAALVFGP
jgi:hypothetical protein